MQKDSAQAKILPKVVGGGATFLTHPVQCESKKITPQSFLAFSQNSLEFFVQILRACYTFLSTLDYMFSGA